jgi:hypothetical protein
MMLPILILAFNRADCFDKTIRSILQQEHGDIYVSCDGPRLSSPNETQEVRHLILSYQERGDVKVANLLETNLGTLDGIHAGIDWFFENESEGLIVEDDLILHPPILEEAEKLFDAFRADPCVGSIGLRNVVPSEWLTDPHASYRRSRLFVSTGWGTSRIYWTQGRKSLIDRKNWLPSKKLRGFFGLGVTFQIARDYRIDAINEIQQRNICNWDNRWSATHLSNNWNCLILNHNRVEYIGYGPDATHTKGLPKPNSIERSFALDNMEWKIPDNLDIDTKADWYLLRKRGFVAFLKTKAGIRTRFRALRTLLLRKN